MIAMTSIMLLAGMVASSYQFVDETTTRFPQPGLLEYTNQVTVGDLDGDGDLDLVFANGGNFSSAGIPQKLRVFINNGAGVFTDETDARTGGLTFIARGAELGDVDRDGDLDIIIAQDFNRQPTLLINNGSGVFTNETAARLPTGTFSSSRAQFADVDNDGDLDLYLTNGGAVSRFGSGRGKLWLNDGNGVFTDVTATHTPNQNVSEPQDCIFGDVDGDFDLDLVIGSTNTNQSRLYLNNGQGVFAAQTFPADRNAYSYDFGDINSDGNLDLVGANANPTILNAELVLQNNGSGVFTPTAFTGASTDDNDSKFIDIDNDGDLDLVICAIGGPERTYLNDGNGTFTLGSRVITPVNDSSLDVMVADFNGDGRYDIVTGQGESGSYLNRIYMNVSGPIDNRPPTIVRLENPGDVTSGEARPVRVQIVDAHTSDRGFHDKGITLWWRMGGVGAFAAADMQWSGNSQWRGVIPQQSHSGLIEYYVEARDFANNIAVGDTDSYTVTLPCIADITDDGLVNVTDLLAVIGAWGACSPPCPPDINTDGQVNVTDLLAVIGAWGPCP